MPPTTRDHPSPAGPAATTRLAIDGGFLRPAPQRCGVHRVAVELVRALDRVLADDAALAAALDCRVLVPGEHDVGLSLSRIRVERHPLPGGLSHGAHRIAGVLWEQAMLPRLARGRTLLSLCDSGPVLHRDAFTLVHDARVYTSPDSCSRAFSAWQRTVLPLLGRRHRALLTVSEHTRRQLARLGIAAARDIPVIPNGCDHVLRVPAEPGAVAAAGLADAPYVLALANHQPHKNIQVLLRAFEAPDLRGTTLALFGPARREDFERQGLRVPPNARFLGFVDDARLAGLMHGAVALAFPSLAEGFGLPPLEAMALGCPTIVAPRGALPEVCGDAALWADAGDPRPWIEHVVRLRDDAGLRASEALRGRARAARFTWEAAATRLLGVVLGHDPVDGTARP